MTRSTDTRRPSWPRLLREAPALVPLLAAQLRPWSAVKKARRSFPVIVIPGYLAPDFLTRPLRNALAAAGHRPFGWGQGVNSGARGRKLAGLLQRIDRLFEDEGEKLVLVGWSLGGLYAREAAKRRPDKVALVVSLGTPIAHGLRENNVWKLYEALNDHDVDHPPVRVNPPEKPPVRTVAIWSSTEGLVAPASASGKSGDSDEQVEVHCPHNQLVSHPEAVAAVLKAIDGGSGRKKRRR